METNPCGSLLVRSRFTLLPPARISMAWLHLPASLHIRAPLYLGTSRALSTLPSPLDFSSPRLLFLPPSISVLPRSSLLARAPSLPLLPSPSLVSIADPPTPPQAYIRNLEHTASQPTTASPPSPPLIHGGSQLAPQLARVVPSPFTAYSQVAQVNLLVVRIHRAPPGVGDPATRPSATRALNLLQHVPEGHRGWGGVSANGSSRYGGRGGVSADGSSRYGGDHQQVAGGLRLSFNNKTRIKHTGPRSIAHGAGLFCSGRPHPIYRPRRDRRCGTCGRVAGGSAKVGALGAPIPYGEVWSKEGIV